MRSIPLLVPHMPSADQILPYLQQIDVNQKYTNFGPLNTEFERRIAASLDGADGFEINVTTVSNCTVGIELALQALKLRPGARILMPGITFVATATAALRVGCVPVFSDVDPANWLLTPAIAESATHESRIDAVVPVSTFGCPQPVAEWDAFSELHDIPVVIDAAGAFGNQGVGQTTDVVYSFHATKSFGAAEGGAVVSGDRSRIGEIRKLANFGIDTSIAMLTGVGTNAKMSEYQCAIGLASFDMWDETKQRRIELFTRYKSAISGIGLGIGFQDKPDDGIYPLFPILLPRGMKASEAAVLFSRDGIETRRWYCPPLYEHPALTTAERTSSTAMADDIGQRIIGLPFFLGMSNDQITHIASTLRAIISGYK